MYEKIYVPVVDTEKNIGGGGGWGKPYVAEVVGFVI